MKLSLVRYLKICLICLVLFTQGDVFCQIQLGINGGYNYLIILNDKHEIDQAQYSEARNSFMFSLTACQSSSHIFNLGIALEYLHQSFDVIANPRNTNANLHFTTNILNFQLQPRFVFGSNCKFFIYPGLYFGKTINSHVNGTLVKWGAGPGKPEYDTVSGNANQYFPWMDFGLIAGIGFNIPLYHNIKLQFENSYTYSFTGISWGTNNSHFFNINIEVGLSYTFPKENGNK